jgi:hypothetical protein
VLRRLRGEMPPEVTVCLNFALVRVAQADFGADSVHTPTRRQTAAHLDLHDDAVPLATRRKYRQYFPIQV